MAWLDFGRNTKASRLNYLDSCRTIGTNKDSTPSFLPKEKRGKIIVPLQPVLSGPHFIIPSIVTCSSHHCGVRHRTSGLRFIPMRPFTCSLLGWLHSHLTPGAPRLSSLSKWLLFLTVHDPFYHRLCYNTDAKRHYSNQLRLWNLNWWCIWKKYVIGVEFRCIV